jgi:hypothetical protein
MTPGLAVFLSKLRGLFDRTGSDSEFTDELQIHLQLLTERFVG